MHHFKKKVKLILNLMAATHLKKFWKSWDRHNRSLEKEVVLKQNNWRNILQFSFIGEKRISEMQFHKKNQYWMPVIFRTLGKTTLKHFQNSLSVNTVQKNPNWFSFRSSRLKRRRTVQLLSAFGI